MYPNKVNNGQQLFNINFHKKFMEVSGSSKDESICIAGTSDSLRKMATHLHNRAASNALCYGASWPRALG